jgi:hypothetical protein
MRFLLKLIQQTVDGDGQLQRGLITKDALWEPFHWQELDARSGAGMVDQITAHDSSSYSEKMPTILPVDVLRCSEAQEGFVYERCRLKSVTRPFAAETVSRDLAQVWRQQFEKPCLGLPVARAPSL